MFGDEVGTDTNHMDDGNSVGQRYISIEGMENNLLSPKAPGCFTLMGLTSATGEPVLCICILSAQILSVIDVKGVNTTRLSCMTQVRPWRKT